MHNDDLRANEAFERPEPGTSGLPNLSGFLDLLRMAQSNLKEGEMYLEPVLDEGWALSAILPQKPHICIAYRSGKVMTGLRRPGVEYARAPGSRWDNNLYHLDIIVENAALEAKLRKLDMYVYGHWLKNGLNVWWMAAWRVGLQFPVGEPYLRITPGDMITLHRVSDGANIIG